MKQYKNVYTILEKVKKGEIQSYYKEKDGLFSKVNFYKKTDLVKPYMHYIDEKNLSKIVHSYIKDGNVVSSFLKNIPSNKSIDPSDFLSKVLDTFRNFPESLQRDIFKMFYHKIDNIDFEDRTDKNNTQYKFIEKSNNPVSKIMTQESLLKSSMFTRELISQYCMKLAYLNIVDPEQHKNMMNDLNSNNDPTSNDIEKSFDQMISSTGGSKTIDQALQRATNICNKLDQSIPEDLQDKLFDNATEHSNNLNAANITIDNINNIGDSILSIKMSTNGIKNILKKLLDRTVNQFSAKPYPIYEDLFNSDNVANLDDYIALHPKLRKIMAEDILIKDNKYMGKINIYVDISGSMSDYCGITNPATQKSMSKIDFAKSFIAEMTKQNLLNNIYSFDTLVRPVKNDIINIALLGTGGGTRIDCTINHIINHTHCNSIILTDAEDCCSMYSEKAFFIGVKGAKFNHFNLQVLKQYSENQQLIVFDGTKISSVDETGKIKK